LLPAESVKFHEELPRAPIQAAAFVRSDREEAERRGALADAAPSIEMPSLRTIRAIVPPRSSEIVWPKRLPASVKTDERTRWNDQDDEVRNGKVGRGGARPVGPKHSLAGVVADMFYAYIGSLAGRM
jgi:hypothetical protein